VPTKLLSIKRLTQFMGITLFILASAIATVLWQERSQLEISDEIAIHQLIIVNSVKMKEELANMQLYLAQLMLTGTKSGIHSQDLYGGRFNPAISLHRLQIHLGNVIELQNKLGSADPLSIKLGSQLDRLFLPQPESNPVNSDAFAHARLMLQGLMLSVEQFERSHDLKYKEQVKRLDLVSRRDNWSLVAFLITLALLSYFLIRWALNSINRSLTELHSSEQQLLHSQQQLNNLLKALPDSVLRLNSDGKILGAIGSHTILEIADDNIVGKFLNELSIPIEVQRGLIQAVKIGLTTAGTYIYAIELPQSNQVYEARIVKYRDDEVLCIVRNITSEEAIRKEQEILTTELEVKNAELERFVYTASHDLKTPLVTINGFIGLLQKAIAANDSKQINNDLNQITLAANRMGELLDGLLELSRIGRIVNPPETGSLTDLVKQAVETVQKKLDNRGVELDIDTDMPRFWGDRLRLLEVFQNLIENSIKFMGDQPVPRIRISAVQNDSDVICRVEDNGIGIDPKYHDRIFNLFERLNPEIDGTGIGMSLVQRIIEAHGGSIVVESAGDQQGCSIMFTLPVKPDLDIPGDAQSKIPDARYAASEFQSASRR